MQRDTDEKTGLSEAIGVFPEFAEDPRPAADAAGLPTAPPAPRVRQAVREQRVLRPINLEELVGEDHPVRVVWAYVEEADLSALYASIKAVEGRPGRAATDPKILLALWMFATLEGVGSARALERLCRDHGAYQWICGGVGMNAHTLSDFRVDHEAVLDQLLTQGVAALMVERLVTLNRVAQDGTRVRASAGAASFRRSKTLKESLRVARQQVRRLRAELDQDPGATSRRQQAAQERAASDRLERVRRALRRLPEMAAKKKGDTKAEARASTTDPSATVMKMADGGFRPAYNVHLCTDTASQVNVGVEVSTAGNDQGEMLPMLEQLRARYGQVPQEILVDGGYVKKDDFDRAAQPDLGCVVYAPVAKPRSTTTDPFAPKAGDSDAVIAWRQRMATPEAKKIYTERAATAECVHALARNRGLRLLPVRGRLKVRAVALLYALVHNVMRAAALRAAAMQPA